MYIIHKQQRKPLKIQKQSNYQNLYCINKTYSRICVNNMVCIIQYLSTNHIKVISRSDSR